MPLAVLLLIFIAAGLPGQQISQPPQIGRPPTHMPIPGAVQQPPSLIRLTSTPSWIDTTNRATVVASYLNTFLPTAQILPGWTGNVITGDAGATTQTYRDAVLQRVNWFRQMAGVPTPISFTAAFNTSDQQAALMMSVNAQVNHMPPTSWTFYSASGAVAAANSNLCLEIPYLNDPGCVALYMQDTGSTNGEVGHRRWLLYPQTQNMGTGDVQPPYPLAFANALYVFDSHYYDARPATRDNFVAWPPPGYVPAAIVPGRWSFSYPSADFTNATVTMQRAGGSVAVRLESPLPGYGENTMVWVPDNIDTSVATHWPVPSADTPIAVTVSHVMVAGVDRTFTYTVTVIDTSSGLNISGHVTNGSTALANASLSLSGGPAAITDASGAYAFGPVPLTTYLIVPTLAGYAFSPSSRSVSASTTAADFTAAYCDYSRLGGAFPVAARAGTGTYTYSIAPGCPWTATSNASWLTIDSGSLSGNGPMNVNFSFSTDNGPARTATLTISGHTIGVTQPSAGLSQTGPVNMGYFLNGTWVIDSNGNGAFDAADKLFVFGIFGNGDIPVIGDWNGDGFKKAGVFHTGFWALDFDGNGRFEGLVKDRFYTFGGAYGEVPIVGDWNGDGRSKIGYYHNGFWALDYNGNGQWDGPVVDRFYAFGGDPAAIPLVGDWNGDGRTKIGFYLRGNWVLDYNGNGTFDGVVTDRYYTYTNGSGEIPVVGDWTGSGTTKIGLYRNGFWTLNTSGTGSYTPGVDRFTGFGGNAGEIPLVGDWTGDGTTKIGFYLRGFWALDMNGNGTFDGLAPGQDRFSAFGGNPGEILVPGKW